MVGQCSRRPNVTSGQGGLMTDWCLSSITVSTLPTPVGQLNGSILSVKPPISLSLFLSFSSLFSLFHSPPPGSLTAPLQSVCLGRREALWEFNCLVFP